MDDLDVDTLALALKGHLPPEIVTVLKDQCVSGACFISLQSETLKLFNFPLGHIFQIMKVISEFKSGSRVLQPSSQNDEYSDSGFISMGQGENDHCDSENSETEEDNILCEFVNGDYLKTVPAYLKTSMCGKVKRWKNLRDMGLPHGSAPDLSIPAKYLKTNPIPGSKPVGNKAQRTGKSKSNEETDSHTQKASSSNALTDTEGSEPEESDDDTEAESRGGEKGHRKVIWFEAPPLQRTSDELKTLSPSLPQYDIEAVLEDDENSKQRTKHLVQYLKSGKLLGTRERKQVFRKLGHFLCFSSVDDPSKTSASMREGLAKSIVTTYPQYQKSIDVPGTAPWSHIWNKKGGHLANIIKRIQTGLPDSKRVKKGKIVKRKKAKLPSCTVDIAQLRLLLPTTSRLEIFDGMQKTFPLRCVAREKSATIGEILKDYPHFLHFDGELIAVEYLTMHPTSNDMCPELAKFVPKIIQKWHDTLDVNTKFPDDNMKACLILASKLPHTIRGRSSLPVEEEIVVVIKPGISVENFVLERRQSQKKAVQPYILALRGQVTAEILKYFLVLDDDCVDLGRIPFLRCIDWLFKTYVVFNVKYPDTWAQFFRFLQTCFYKIYFSSKIDTPPTSIELYNKLKSL